MLDEELCRVLAAADGAVGGVKQGPSCSLPVPTRILSNITWMEGRRGSFVGGT